METDWSKVIERYLGGELSAEGIEAFEFELSLNPDLRSELDLHKMIRESVFRSAERLAIQSIGTKYHFRLKLKKWLMFTSVVVTVSITIALVGLNNGASESKPQDARFVTETQSNNEPQAIETIDSTGSSMVESTPVKDYTSPRIFRRNNDRIVENTVPVISVPVPAKSDDIISDNSQNKESAVKSPELKDDRKNASRKKQRLIFKTGLQNPTDVKEGIADSQIPSGAHWTLGNFMIYASEEGITFHNFLTDDLIIVGRTPKDQLKPPTNVPKDKEGVEETDPEKDKGKIYLQNY